MKRALLALAAFLSLGLCAAHADDLRESGKLLLTQGVSNIEGASGGGLSTWAVIGGYETRDGVGGNVHATEVRVSDFELRSAGAAVGLYDRVELSYARQQFNTLKAGEALGLGRGYTIDQDVVDVKARLIGNLVYDQDTWLPQIAVGAQYKHNDREDLVKALGAKSADGVDYYAAASKLILSQSLLLNATVRETRANQFGILGFGGDRQAGYRPQFEGSAAYLVNRKLAIGAEYRTKPDNLSFAREGNAYDAFAAYTLNKTLSVTLAYADLGPIATFNHQRGVYLSLQAGF
ncbi:MAG: DUF3034 family protein [Caulobacteraceae bacterium]